MRATNLALSVQIRSHAGESANKMRSRRACIPPNNRPLCKKICGQSQAAIEQDLRSESQQCIEVLMPSTKVWSMQQLACRRSRAKGGCMKTKFWSAQEQRRTHRCREVCMWNTCLVVLNENRCGAWVHAATVLSGWGCVRKDCAGVLGSTGHQKGAKTSWEFNWKSLRSQTQRRRSSRKLVSRECRGLAWQGGGVWMGFAEHMHSIQMEGTHRVQESTFHTGNGHLGQCIHTRRKDWPLS